MLRGTAVIRTLLVDDEPPARTAIRQLLAADPEIDVLGECDNGEDAVSTISKQHPDLVYLDVQMPELNGLQVVERIGVDHMPVAIFVTAYERYAVQAFEIHAADYLLKPVEARRFAEALKRAKSRIAGKDLNREVLRRLLDEVGRKHEQIAERLPIVRRGSVSFVNTVDIDWIEADGNYTRLHVGSREFEIRETLAGVARKLDPNLFVRIHRCTIVNIRSIREIHPWFRGHHVVLLTSGTELRMSRYQSEAARRLGIG